jgi:hypothetical protein
LNLVGDHTVCVPGDATDEQIKEYVVELIVVEVELNKKEIK